MLPSTLETAGFKTAMVHYEIFKSNMPVLRGDINACEQLEKAKPEVKAMLKIFGLQEKCPFEPVTYIQIKYSKVLTNNLDEKMRGWKKQGEHWDVQKFASLS